MTSRKKKVIAIFDVGKTNKKLFLLDEDYTIVFEKSMQFAEIKDEDGDPAEDVEDLKRWVLNSLSDLFRLNEFKINAANFSAYGASLVYLDQQGNIAAPLYDYLKPYPDDLKDKFFSTYGGQENFSSQTASPALGSLNSGMQLYRIKYQKPELFQQIKYALHLPQFLSYLITGKPQSDLTSIGCHTNLWDFRKKNYYEWVTREGIADKLAPIISGTKITVTTYAGCNLKVGVGLHDSSAALIPYLSSFNEPFILISTGTWCISLNPFNDSPLTKREMEQDSLCYLQYTGKPVKASRLFSGHAHDKQVNRIAKHFQIDRSFHKNMQYNSDLAGQLDKRTSGFEEKEMLSEPLFAQRNLVDFISAEGAYHQLIYDLVAQQYISTHLVMSRNIKHIFVDGGFSNNVIFMNMLASFFPNKKIYAASAAQASAIGAALAIHKHWNKKALPANIIQLKFYSNRVKHTQH